MYLVYMEKKRYGVGKPTQKWYVNIMKGRETPGTGMQIPRRARDRLSGDRAKTSVRATKRNA
jgi:hypothetical protein